MRPGQGLPPPGFTLRLPRIRLVLVEQLGNIHDRRPQSQRVGHLPHTRLPPEIRMAACSALTPQSKLGLPQRSTKPNDPVPPRSGIPQPPRQEIQTLQLVDHPAIATTRNRIDIPHEDGTSRQSPQLLHGARHHLLLRFLGRLSLRGPPQRF